jgi:hypothetical protein
MLFIPDGLCYLNISISCNSPNVTTICKTTFCNETHHVSMNLLGWRCKDNTVEDEQCKLQQTRSTFADWIKSSGDATSARLVAAQEVAK